MNIAKIEHNKLKQANAQMRHTLAAMGKDLAKMEKIVAEYQRRFGVLNSTN